MPNSASGAASAGAASAGAALNPRGDANGDGNVDGLDIAFVKAPGTWSYSPEQCVEIARRDYTPDVTEFHIVGGLHPHWKFDVYVDILKALKKAFPKVHLKAFTMVEIDWLARLAKMSIEDNVDILRKAGLDSCPGVF